MPTPIRKLAFYEVGKGKYAEMMQENFEKASKLSVKRNAAITIQSTIVIYPPARDSKGTSEPFGDISFSVALKVPAATSRKYSTEIDKDGNVLQDGENIADLLQERLKFPEETEGGLRFRAKSGNE